MSARDLGSLSPGARDRIFARSPQEIDGLFAQLVGADLHETTEAIVTSLARQWQTTHRLTEKQTRLLETIVRRGR